jgi:glutamate carboxypeptidase
MRAVLLLLAALLWAAPAAAKPTAAEQKIIRTVDAEQARTVDLLEKLVNQNSGTWKASPRSAR